MYLPNINSLNKALTELQQDSMVLSILLFAADKNPCTFSEIENALRLNFKPLIGGVFPEIIADGERKNSGFLVIPLYEVMQVIHIETNDEIATAQQLETKLTPISESTDSVFCFVNALWTQKTVFMNSLYDELGPFVHYLGGGAGSLSFQSFPCLFCNQFIFENGAVLGSINSNMSIGVAHGWHAISDPIKVTEVKGNTIVSLNWKPAFEVYKHYAEGHSNQIFTSDNFFDIAKSYPLGLVKLDDEMIIRDPYAQENGHLHIVDLVPEGEYIRIMHGDMTSLLEGASNAVSNSENSEFQHFTQFCIDCISRVLFMQNDFEEELKYLNKNQKANGILSIGEIANPGNAALELFNKTVVVAQWNKIG